MYKWADMTSMSIQVVLADGTTTKWVSMPTRSDEAMALLAPGWGQAGHALLGLGGRHGLRERVG